MKKSSIFARGLLVGSFALLSAAAQAETLIVTTNVPPQHWASTQGAEPFMACVKDATKGQISFNYFPSGQLANFFESLNAVNKGLAQISYIVVTAQTDKLPLNGIPLLPEMGNTVVEMTETYRKVLGGNGPIAQEYAKNRIRPLLINMFPQYQMLSRAQPMDSLEKLKGKKISSGGGSLIFTLNGLGANAIEMAAADLYLALQQGTVDGTMLALASVKPYKLQEVVKAMSSNGRFGGAVGVWSIDIAVWDKLSPENQKALTDCGLKVEAQMAKWVDNWTQELKAEFVSAGVNVFEYSEQALAAMSEPLKASREAYVSRLASRGLPAKEAYEEYLKALGK